MDIKYHPNLEKELADMLAAEIQKELDKDIMHTIKIEHYKQQGRHAVDLRDIKAISMNAIITWCNEVGISVTDDVIGVGKYFLFKQEDHAALFILKWK